MPKEEKEKLESKTASKLCFVVSYFHYAKAFNAKIKLF